MSRLCEWSVPVTGIALLAALIGFPRAALFAQQRPAVFPTVTGRNLEGRDLTLPGDFAGERNVVIVAFRQRQQRDVNSWLPALKELQREDLGLEIYEIPTLGRGWIPLRGWIDGGMASGIRDRGTREATITLYLAKGPFKEALGITTEREIQLLLMERDGVVRHRARGAFTPAALAGLRKALALP
jgi:hypothetical protein